MPCFYTNFVFNGFGFGLGFGVWVRGSLLDALAVEQRQIPVPEAAICTDVCS